MPQLPSGKVYLKIKKIEMIKRKDRKKGVLIYFSDFHIIPLTMEEYEEIGSPKLDDLIFLFSVSKEMVKKEK